MENFFDDFELALSLAQEEVKENLKHLKCKTHKNKGRVSFDYDNLGLNAYIKCCCIDHANKMKKAISETQSFRKIEIENLTYK